MTTTDGLTPTQFLEADGTADWRVVDAADIEADIATVKQRD